MFACSCVAEVCSFRLGSLWWDINWYSHTEWQTQTFLAYHLITYTEHTIPNIPLSLSANRQSKTFYDCRLPFVSIYSLLFCSLLCILFMHGIVRFSAWNSVFCLAWTSKGKTSAKSCKNENIFAVEVVTDSDEGNRLWWQKIDLKRKIFLILVLVYMRELGMIIHIVS